MNRAWRRLLLALVLLPTATVVAAETIAFGSCLRQWQPQPVWQAVLDAAPDIFVFVGDNVYTDTGPYRNQAEPERIARAYAELGGNPGFQALRRALPVFATWDDHDYGRNDAGAEYPWKLVSKAAFMDFFGVPNGHPMRQREGIFSEHWLGTGAERIQLLLLDVRSFRGPLLKGETSPECPRVRYQPNNDPAANMLGEAQWRWLASRLREPALLRILVSGIQVIPDGHCYEKWANFPRERARLFDLIRDSGVNGVVLVSGDRHLAEISMLPAVGVGHPLYELTTSGLNSAGAGAGESNPYRTTPDNFRGDNFGVIRLLREGGEPRVEIQVRNVTGAVVLSESVPLARLVPPRPEGGKTARGDLP